jgi:hypothetical protein
VPREAEGGWQEGRGYGWLVDGAGGGSLIYLADGTMVVFGQSTSTIWLLVNCILRYYTYKRGEND